MSLLEAKVSYDSTDCTGTPVHIVFPGTGANTVCRPQDCRRADETLVVGNSYIRQCIPSDSQPQFILQNMGKKAYTKSTHYTDAKYCSIGELESWLHPLDTCYNINTATATWKSEKSVLNADGSLTYFGYNDAVCAAGQFVQKTLNASQFGTCINDSGKGFSQVLGRGSLTGNTLPLESSVILPNTASAPSSTPVGAIAGGAAGGVIVLAAVIFGVMHCRKQKRVTKEAIPVTNSQSQSNIPPPTGGVTEQTPLVPIATNQTDKILPSKTLDSKSDLAYSALNVLAADIPPPPSYSSFTEVDAAVANNPDHHRITVNMAGSSSSFAGFAPQAFMQAQGDSYNEKKGKMEEEEDYVHLNSEYRKAAMGWTVEQVGNWAVENGGSEMTRQKIIGIIPLLFVLSPSAPAQLTLFTLSFSEHKIDGKALMLMRREDIESVLKVTAYGELLRLQDAIKQIKS
ncbi:hypothetical protein HDU81_002227 [Chytriomyces hyalinus]|nr:hypothetical protein HDU81_002227 [Chytriomyces hyalinus]